MVQDSGKNPVPTVDIPGGLTLTLDRTRPLELASESCLEGYRDIRIAAATPAIRLGNIRHNEEEILTLMAEAQAAGADVLVFSDMPLTGRTAGDLFFQRALQDAVLESLARITRATASSHILVLLSLPLRLENRLFKASAILYRGEIVGMTPASFLSDEESRWFSDPLAWTACGSEHFSCELIADAGGPPEGVTEVRLPPLECPVILRHPHGLEEAAVKEEGSHDVGFELSLCDITAQNLLSFTFRFVNLCTVIPCLAVRPSLLAGDDRDGEEVRLFNFEPQDAKEALAHGSIPLAAITDGRPEWTGDYRRIRQELIRRSLYDRSIVVYAGGGRGESASQGIYAGRRLIISDGRVLAEGAPFTTGLTLADIPAAELFQVRSGAGPRWDIQKGSGAGHKNRNYDRHPFLMRSELDASSLFFETLAIQGQGLAARLELLGARPVIGLSGGLDSAVALLASLEALRILGRPSRDLLAVSMPGPGTTEKSRELARDLASAFDLDFREIPIHEAVALHLAAIGHKGGADVTFENAQARERTQILMDLSNLEGGIVVGTGDLSELALGWCTYNADQMSMYAVNASLAKTVIRDMTGTAAGLLDKGRLPLITDPGKAALAARSLRTILGRPVSPELLPPDEKDGLTQLTEDSVGPYELVDFFLWHLVFEGRKPSAVYEKALLVFGEDYPPEAVQRWLHDFTRRFFRSQFKRTASPEGVSAFPRRLVPYTAWQMPGDAGFDLWTEELDLAIQNRKDSPLDLP